MKPFTVLLTVNVEYVVEAESASAACAQIQREFDDGYHGHKAEGFVQAIPNNWEGLLATTRNIKECDYDLNS